MPRSTIHAGQGRRPIVVAVLVLVVLALLPVRHTRWLTSFRNLAGTLVAPVTAPVAGAVRWVRGGVGGVPDSGEVDRLRHELDLQRLRAMRAESDLRDALQKLGQVASLPPTDEPIRFVYADVIGPSASASGGVVQVRAGSRRGVGLNAVATVDGIQLLGRVIDVSSRAAWIRLLTDRNIGPVDGVITFPAAGPGGKERRLQCPLFPADDGRLRGVVEYAPRVGDEEGPRVDVGMPVHLLNESRAFPRGARLLLIGKVEQIEPVPQMPLRQLIYVRPAMDLSLVTEVVLRVPVRADEPELEESGGGGR